MRLAVCLAGALTASCVIATETKAPSGFCEAARALVRAPLSEDGLRSVSFDALEALEGASGFSKVIQFAEPKDDAAQVFFDSLELLTPGTEAPVVAAKIGACFDPSSGFTATELQLDTERAARSAFPYLTSFRDTLEGRSVMVRGSANGVAILVAGRRGS
jgi:hypothetical protein